MMVLHIYYMHSLGCFTAVESAGSVQNAARGRARRSNAESSVQWDRVVVFHCFDVYHKSPDAGERHTNQGPETGDLILLGRLAACSYANAGVSLSSEQ